MTRNLGRFLAAVLLIAAAPARLQAEEPAQGVDPSLVIEQFDVFNDGDLLLVPVTAFGKTRMFAVDTGCSLMLYDKSLRPFLGKPQKSVIGSTPQGKVTVEMFDSPKPLLGKLSLHTEQPVGCVDLSQFSQFSGHDIAGFVGISMLQRYVVQIDFDAGKLAFLKQVPEHAGEQVEFTWHGAIPAVQAEMSGLGSELFLIDTGFFSHDAGILNPETAATLTVRDLAEAQELRAYSRDLSGTIVQKLLRIKGLRLSSYRMLDVPMSTGEPKKPSVLSLGLLSRFTVTFDFPNRAIYLKKSKQFDRPYRLTSAGIIFVREGANVVVEAVREDRPAAKAGIKVKDVVLKVGEQETSGARLFKLYDEFRSPGQTVRVKLKRGDEIIETDVKLPDEDDKGSAAKPQNADS